jgi:hypothetical protein
MYNPAMGVVRPSWITVEWFAQCPYNYCDHFGDKSILARVCQFCLEDLVRDKRPSSLQQLDPFNIQFLIIDIPKEVSKILVDIDNAKEKLGLTLEERRINLSEDQFGNFAIYKVALEYGYLVEEIMHLIESFPKIKNRELAEALSHSRYYVQVKISRALSSKNEEQKNPTIDLFDSKTSALFAYLAAMRNSQETIKFVEKAGISLLIKKQLLEFALTSIKIAELIRNQFFPLELTFEQLDLEEVN